jgi:hypothetical protein
MCAAELRPFRNRGEELDARSQQEVGERNFRTGQMVVVAEQARNLGEHRDGLRHRSVDRVLIRG